MVNNFKRLLSKILNPKESQFNSEISLEQVMEALNDPTVRKYWVESMIEKIRDANMELDNLLAKEDRQRSWETFAIERRTLLRCITMILDSRDMLDSERDAQERQNRYLTQYQGAAAALPLDNRPNNRASD